jgi:hypothetical protein
VKVAGRVQLLHQTPLTRRVEVSRELIRLLCLFRLPSCIVLQVYNATARHERLRKDNVREVNTRQKVMRSVMFVHGKFKGQPELWGRRLHFVVQTCRNDHEPEYGSSQSNQIKNHRDQYCYASRYHEPQVHMRNVEYSDRVLK